MDEAQKQVLMARLAAGTATTAEMQNAMALMLASLPTTETITEAIESYCRTSCQRKNERAIPTTMRERIWLWFSDPTHLMFCLMFAIIIWFAAKDGVHLGSEAQLFRGDSKTAQTATQVQPAEK